MKKKTVCCSDLGAYINELLKRAKLKNEYVCETLGMGHDVLNGIKRAKSPIERLYKSNESLFECLQRRGD